MRACKEFAVRKADFAPPFRGNRFAPGSGEPRGIYRHAFGRHDRDRFLHDTYISLPTSESKPIFGQLRTNVRIGRYHRLDCVA